MHWEIARAAIDYAVESCRVHQGLTPTLIFHGQGEPTLHWTVFCKCVHYYESMCNKLDFAPHISLTSNGILTESKLRYMRDHRIAVSISMDCSTPALNILRPMRNGGNLLQVLRHTLATSDELGLSVSLRSTVTPENVNDMSELVSFANQFRICRHVQFEPVNTSGRAMAMSLDDSFFDSYIRNFEEARLVGYRTGIEVVHASSIQQKRDRFCGATGNELNLCVSTTGNLASCYEHVTDDDMPDPFRYGRYSQGKFDISADAYTALLTKTPVESDCAECFLHSTCAGDCLARRGNNGEGRHLRCYVNREIAKKELIGVFTSRHQTQWVAV